MTRPKSDPHDRPHQRHIFFADDESEACRTARLTLSSLGAEITCFGSGEEVLKAMERGACDVLVSDVKMPGMDGIELLTAVKQRWPLVPVVIVTAYANVPMALRAIKAGAADFVEKPLTRPEFTHAVMLALKQTQQLPDHANRVLTPAEVLVLKLVAEGKSNSEIAYAMRRSVRTVEYHRHHLMKKLNVDSTAALTKVATGFGLASTAPLAGDSQLHQGMPHISPAPHTDSRQIR